MLRTFLRLSQQNPAGYTGVWSALHHHRTSSQKEKRICVFDSQCERLLCLLLPEASMRIVNRCTCTGTKAQMYSEIRTCLCKSPQDRNSLPYSFLRDGICKSRLRRVRVSLCNPTYMPQNIYTKTHHRPQPGSNQQISHAHFVCKKFEAIRGHGPRATSNSTLGTLSFAADVAVA